MTRKQMLLIAVLLVASSSVAALLAYRFGLHHSASREASPFALSRGAKGSCVDFQEAMSHLGETTCVSGRVLRVYSSRAGNSFLDFCEDYRACPFSSVIFSTDRRKFANLEILGGRQVELGGTIRSYQGHAEIVIHDPQQIRVLP